MRKSKSDTLPMARQTNLPKVIKGVPATILDKYGDGDRVSTEFDNEVEEEAPSNLCPVVDFELPGQFIIGYYIGCKPNIGPNASNMYMLRIDGGPVVGVWGSTALDTTMQLWNPPTGSLLQIIFTGLAPTARGLNPVKTFKVRRLKKKS